LFDFPLAFNKRVIYSFIKLKREIERRSLMKCPVCKTSSEHAEIDLHSEGFTEEINTCAVCDTMWSVNHGATNIVKDPLQKSFLSALTVCVGADEYSFAA
jgi:hypothetical protein